MAPSLSAYIVDAPIHFKKNRKLLLLLRVRLSVDPAGALRISAPAMADLFATSDAPRAIFETIDGRAPVLLIDGIFRDAHAVREAALKLDYSAGMAHYPGRIARFPPGDPSLTGFLQKIVELVQAKYLPFLPPAPDALPRGLRGLDTDFAITDLRPDQLSSTQRKPHIDAVPVFGLIYLNDPPRGGTLFFRKKQRGAELLPAEGYPTADDEQLELCYRVEGLFNRLAIYPGFVLHSGEIEGDWITGEDRFLKPRLTQRIQFFL